MEKLTSVFVVEDHPAIVTGIKGYLKEIEPPLFEVVGKASTVEEAEAFLNFQAQTFSGIVVLDIGLGGQAMYGFDFANRIKEIQNAAIKIIVYSMRNEVEVIRKMIETGICGYVDKNVSLDVLYEALVQVAEGEDYYSRGSVSKAMTFIIKNAKTGVEFTQTENEVMNQMRQGHLTYKAIAEAMNRSPRTVEQHLKSLYHKSGTNNMASLLNWIMQHTQ